MGVAETMRRVTGCPAYNDRRLCLALAYAKLAVNRSIPSANRGYPGSVPSQYRPEHAQGVGTVETAPLGKAAASEPERLVVADRTRV